MNESLHANEAPAAIAPKAASGGPGGKQPAPVRPNHELIAALAFQYWVERGLPAEVNWQQAETQLWFTFVRAVDNFRS